MIRRDPNAILIALRMDPARRHLFVEGHRDRLFFDWLVSDRIHPDATILEIDLVDIPDQGVGGMRARLLAFARLVSDQQERLMCFADADYDRLFARDIPKFVWMTDGRDLEGYVLNVECFDKVLRVGVATDTVDAEELLKIVREIGRPLGLLRVLSEMNELFLPFQKTNLGKFIKLDDGAIRLNFQNYLKALLQNADMGLDKLSNIQEDLMKLQTDLNEQPDDQIIHGKDAFCIIEKALARFGVKSGEAAKLMWTSFEARFVKSGSNLDAAVNFLQ